MGFYQKNPLPKTEPFIHRKYIRLIIKKQLKRQCPNLTRLNKKTMIDHTPRLSKFMSCLSFVQQINLLVYILHYFYKSGLFGDCVVHGIDSNELANDCKVPLASLDINGKKIRIYNDIDSDCGARRNKRDKSVYLIGYLSNGIQVLYDFARF